MMNEIQKTMTPRMEYSSELVSILRSMKFMSVSYLWNVARPPEPRTELPLAVSSNRP